MKLIFIDRDGVINRNFLNGYVKSWGEFSFLPGALEAIKRLTDNGYAIVVLSNQAGVAKGLYSSEALNEITSNMLDEIEFSGGAIKAVYYCPHRDEDDCRCRKPKPGLFNIATEQMGIETDLSDTYFIGDALTDVDAGKRAGCKTILVLSGKTALKGREDWVLQPDYIAQNLAEAVDLVLREECGIGL